jgi:hypothetical protein
MTNFTKYLAGAAAIGGIAAPLAAQNPYPYPQQGYPQQGYPQQAYPGYGQPGYNPNYNPGYSGNPVTDVIDQLLGNRYNVTDRQAIRQCANAARAQAGTQYRGYGYNNGYNNGYGNHYGQGIAAPSLRVTAITDVQRRSNGLRVKGLMSTGYAGQYGNQYGQNGYQNSGYATGDLSFRCNVDYRGAVTDIRIERNGEYRRY